MMIDCSTCTVRGDACGDCVVTFLTVPVRGSSATARTAAPPGAATAGHPVDARTGAPVELDDAERRAIDVLARSGLVPPLRLRAV